MFSLREKLSNKIRYLKGTSWKYSRTYRRPLMREETGGIKRGYAYLPTKKILFAIDTTSSLVEHHLQDISVAMSGLSKEYPMLILGFSKNITVHKTPSFLKQFKKEDTNAQLSPVLDMAQKEKADVLIIATDLNFSDEKTFLEKIKDLKSHIIIIYPAHYSDTFQKLTSQSQQKITEMPLY